MSQSQSLGVEGYSISYMLKATIPTPSILYLDGKLTMALIGWYTTMFPVMNRLSLRVTSRIIRQTLSLLHTISIQSLMTKSVSSI